MSMGPKKKRRTKAEIEASKTMERTPVVSSDSPGEMLESQPTEDTLHISGVAAPSSDSAPIQSQTVNGKFKEKVTITLDENGGLDLDSMRESTREKVVSAFTKSRAGLFPAIPKAPVKRWSEFGIRAAYSVLGAVEVGIAERKYPPELAQTFAYTDEDIHELMEPTQAVLARYAGNVQHQELIDLALALVGVHTQKLFLVNRAMAEYAKRMEEEARLKAKTPGPAPGDDKAAGGISIT